MGRLIDADKLLNAFGLSENTRKYSGDGSGYNTLMLYEIQVTIEDAAEVDAIPVDWIESYALLAEADGRPFFAEGIRDMVEEWKRDRKVD